MSPVILLLCLFVASSHALENGMARKPPMGWLSWTAFFCETDCVKHPDGCINEQLYKAQADVMVSEGYRDAGYEFVNVDDCWSELEREAGTNKLVAHHERFKSGMKSLADYLHARNLKFGLYTDIGTQTCGKYPGLLTEDGKGNYFDIDAMTYAEWEVDSLKVDGCYIDPRIMGPKYEQFGDALNNTGRPMVYYCSMPFFQATSEPFYKPEQIDFALMKSKCNGWRIYKDIYNKWESVRKIMTFVEQGVDTYRRYSGPGSWADPDMVIVGLEGPDALTFEQARSQFAFWSIMSAPLLLSNDLRHIKPEFKAVMLNKGMIAIDQDERGEMPVQVLDGDTGIWLKPLATPNEFAALWYNWDNGNHWVLNLACPIENLVPGIEGANVYDVINDGKLVGDIKRGNFIGFDMEPDGVQMAKLVIYTKDNSVSEVWRTGNLTKISRSGNEPFPCFLTRPR